MTDPLKSFHRNVFLAGPAGRLEASLWISPVAGSAFAALVCHPHPLYGGTMHNKVVFHVARTLHRLGVPVLRFNFRGAGLSEGTHDNGRGEADDVRTALDFLAEQSPNRPLLLAGFSFGMWVGLQVGCADTRVAELVGLGLPANDRDLSFLGACPKPKLIIQGERDQFGARQTVEALFDAEPTALEPNQTKLVFVPEADHFFTGRLAEVELALSTWLRARHPQLEALPLA